LKEKGSSIHCRFSRLFSAFFLRRGGGNQFFLFACGKEEIVRPAPAVPDFRPFSPDLPSCGESELPGNPARPHNTSLFASAVKIYVLAWVAVKHPRPRRKKGRHRPDTGPAMSRLKTAAP